MKNGLCHILVVMPVMLDDAFFTRTVRKPLISVFAFPGGGAGPCFCSDGTCTLCMFASHLARIGLERHWAPYFFAEGFDNLDHLLSALPTDEYSFTDALYALAVSCELPHEEATLFAAGTTPTRCLSCGGWLLPYHQFCGRCGIPDPNPLWVD